MFKPILPLFFLTVTTLAVARPPAPAMKVAGFERLTTATGVEIGIWYPATGPTRALDFGLFRQDVVPAGPLPKGKHPLVVISHGTGGNFAGHADTATALARAGFIVAALTHPGDNWRDRSRAVYVEDRPLALTTLITYMLGEWRGRAVIDPARVGAFGFSAGGFTVLAAAGGRPDLTRVVPHCRTHPAYFDCKLVATAPPRDATPLSAPIADSRIKALVVAAPALGYSFDKAGLASVKLPIQLWRADEDEILPAPLYADDVNAALPKRPEFHGVQGAGHFDFMPSCSNPAMMPQICTSRPGFDRATFKQRFNADVVTFFRKHLK